MSLPRFNFKFHRRRSAMIAVVAVLALVVALPAHATLGDSIFLILNNILQGMITMFATLTGVFITLLVVVARYNTFLNAPVVQQGWPIVRDLMNMVFIIGLLMISAGTVLRLQNYRYNRLLGKLIIMALLVNFSKFIAVFLLQFGQIVMLTFVNAFRDVAFGNFSHMFGLDAILNFAKENNFDKESNTSGTGMSIFVTMLAGLIMMLIAFVVMLAITVILFVRIIALWLLIILSPLAYALRVLPQTEKYASQWWGEFTKYVVVGPVLAFFLWIALALVSNANCASTNIKEPCNAISQADDKTKDAFQNANQDTRTLRGDLLTEALSLDRMMTFIVGIIFLMMGLQYAQKSGTAGASFAGKVASAGFSAAATATGLNYVRDRYVAPVQGWVKNRQRARESAIQQRTETLEAFGDRARAAAPVVPVIASRAGQRRAAAAANAYERNRTARTGQQLGVKDWSDEQVQREFLTSGNMRNRTMAMEELRSRGGGRLNLADKPMRDAFNTVTSARRSPFSGVNAYMPEADRKKLREETLKNSAAYMQPDDVRRLTPIAENSEERLILEQALETKKASDAKNPADVARVNALRDELRDIPGRLKEFDDALARNNPDMALATIYQGLGQGATTLQEAEQNIGRYVSDVKQGLMATRNLSPELQARVSDKLENLGLNREAASNYVARRFMHGARTNEDRDRIVGGMTEEGQTALLDGARIDFQDAAGVHEMDADTRKWLAAKHFYDEAFTRRNDRGKYEYDKDLANEYAATNAEKIAEGYKNRKISNASLQNEALRDKFDHLVELYDDDVKSLTKDSRKRYFFNLLKAKRVKKLKQDGSYFKADTAVGRENLKDLKQLVLASGGGKVDTGEKDAGGKVIEVDAQKLAYGHADVTVPSGVDPKDYMKQLDDAHAQFVKTKGDTLKFMDYPKLADSTQVDYEPQLAQTIINNISVKDLTSLHDSNTHSVINILGDMRKQMKLMDKDNKLTTDAEREKFSQIDDQYKRLWNIFDPKRGRLKSSDVLNGY